MSDHLAKRDTPLSVRIPEALAARVEAHRQQMAQAANVPVKVSKADAVIEILSEGLKRLEQ